MFRHVVMFSWKPEVDDAHVAELGAALDGLVDAIAEIRSYTHGPDAGLADQNSDYAVVGDFDSVADYEIYRDHPAHRTVVDELVAPYVTARAAVQFQVRD